MNNIINLLNLEENLKIIDVTTENNFKIITVEKDLESHFCPICEHKMYSRGIKTRTIKHQILQDGYNLIIKLRQRRWLCTNQECNYNISDHFNFVSKYKQTTNTSEILVLNALLDLNNTFTDVSRKYNISVSHVVEIFEKHIKMKRLPLSDAISIDEVYLNMEPRCKYVLVIQDFHTGDTIDLVRSRKNKDTEPYFANIPIAERLSVKYLISDMYNPYIQYVDKYFPNAISVVDSFHVIQWLLHRIDIYLRNLLKYYRSLDNERAIKLAKDKNVFKINVKQSDEVYLLEHHKWVLLKNESNIQYNANYYFNHHFRFLINSYGIEERFLSINPDFQIIRDLKEEYISFNSTFAGDPNGAAIELDRLIDIYSSSNIEIFIDFSKTLKRFKHQIINSFIMEERIINGKTALSRLSNGPMESLNRKAKDLKRFSRGYTNFNHFRNRFLFSTRKQPQIFN